MSLAPETFFLSARELGRRIRTGSLSPVTLAEGFLDRLERLGPDLGAVVTVMRDRGLAEARAAEAEIRAGKNRGPLHGVPYGVKDLLAAKGAPTTWGAEPFRARVIDADATAVTKLKEAGAVLLAKLAMVELAGGLGYNNADASFTGPGRTPWNREFWSGGSSSGPGAAVAAGLVPFALGSETSGSILTPAAFSGVTGLRPTYGRVSRHGAMALSYTLDKLGPMTRTADDAGLVLQAIAGRDPLDDSTVDDAFAFPEPPPSRRFRLGVVKGSFEKVQPEVRKSFEASLAVLRTFADLVDVDFPDLPWGPAVSTLVGADAASAYRDLIESGEVRKLRAVRDRIGGYSVSMILAVDYLQAMRLRGPAKRTLHAFFENLDAVVSPSRASVAYPIGPDFDKVYPDVVSGPALIPAGNLAGLPALSVPNGFGANGLPTGLAFLGPAFSEARLVALGAAYQSKTDWHARRPPGF